MKGELGSVIAEAREARDLSQRRLAQGIGISNATINRIEDPDDDIAPDPRTIAGIAKELCLDYNYLLALAGYVKDQPEIRAIQRAAENMSSEQLQKMLKIVSTVFDTEFAGIGSDMLSRECTMPEGLADRQEDGRQEGSKKTARAIGDQP